MGTVHIKVIIICQARHVRIEISQQCAVFLNVRDKQPFLESVCHSQLKSNTNWGILNMKAFGFNTHFLFGAKERRHFKAMIYGECPELSVGYKRVNPLESISEKAFIFIFWLYLLHLTVFLYCF